MEIKPNSKIYIAGHKGMVGSAIWRNLFSRGFNNLIGISSKELDLKNKRNVKDFFIKESPEYVILAAAKVGGINANNLYRADFLYENLQIYNNVIHQSFKRKVKKLLFLGSSCIYPKECNQPIKEEYLLEGPLENTNEPYAISKIAGIKLCENYYKQYGCDFISVMPTNLYGPNDNYDLKTSHVLPALIRKFHEAKINNAPSVELWGSGKALREFLHVDDLAKACFFILNNIDARQLNDDFGISHINIGYGKDISIIELAKLIKKIIGYNGNIEFDETKPDGTLKKLLDSTRLKKIGWSPSVSLNKGVKSTYNDFIVNKFNREFN